ncbi:MAG TPA: MlaD family protein [Solirubrobacteraceae bacterium]|nr:MlaD family protein [Solirubrobacteraceae bacterium]
MRASVAVAAVLLVAALVALVLVTRGEDEAYRVRAVFDNAGFVIAGEDVKVAGVKVGSVEDVEVTDDYKAAIVLRIDHEGYQDFRADAECQVRPQSLIGERFVECSPTRSRGSGEELPPELEELGEGPGEGQRLLPVENTSRAVDLDFINNIMREPYRERFSIILNELGVGLAGRGEDLDAVIRRANPALKEVDDVLKLLARQNEQLEQLAVDSDTVLEPLARERFRVTSSIENMSAVAEATAERRGDLEASIERLPEFLDELTPTMERLGALSDEMTPVLTDLGEVAPDINRFIAELGPFSTAATPALVSLGEAGEVGGPALQRALPVIKDTRTLAAQLKPVARLLGDLLVDFERENGLQEFLNYIFYQGTAVNGFDSFGHYLRAGLLVNQCTTYATEPTGGCSANFRPATASVAAGASSMPRDPVLEWTRRVLSGGDPDLPDDDGGARDDGPASGAGPAPKAGERPAGKGGGGARDRDAAPRTGPTPTPAPTPDDRPAAPVTVAPGATPTPTAAPSPTPQPADPGSDPGEPLLDYLFGSPE